ncbi:MAG: hypothetical protein M1834_001426 [Cirrosporium novae-zelandiae]|nr:MAG: hypothetical protein M1834_001426 [Cirrosporium novae-zelandiae]
MAPIRAMADTEYLEQRPSKKPRLQHHNLHFKQKPPPEPAPPDEEAIHTLLSRSIGIVLDRIGFDGVDIFAAESFRAGVEEYMVHMVAAIRRSMLSCRRTQPTPQDFEQALSFMHVSTSALIPHLQPPVSPDVSQVLSLDLKSSDDFPRLPRLPFLRPDLTGNTDRSQRSYIPQHFPSFPSRHTYKETPDFPNREDDPRKVRERATAEGRLGEEALRKLVAANKGSTDEMDFSKRARTRSSMRAEGQELWARTMAQCAEEDARKDDGNDDLIISYPGSSGKAPAPSIRDLLHGPVVNYDKQFWQRSVPKPSTAKPQKNTNHLEVVLPG